MKYLDAKPYLKEGMKIKIIKSRCCPEITGDTLIVEEVYESCVDTNDGVHSPGEYYPEDEEIEILTNPDGSKWCIHNSTGYGECMGCAQDLAKVFNVPRSATESLTNEPKAQKGLIMNVVGKIKNFKLTKEDRILRENGLEDEDGKITECAENMMDEEIMKERWATRRLEVAKDLLDIKNEDKE